MKKRVFFVLFILGLTLPIAAGASKPQPRQIQPLDAVDVWVDQLGWYNVYWNSLGEDYIISVNIQVTSGGDIDFFICDGENYDIWTSGGTASGYNNKQNVGSISLSFTVPSSGEWHAMFVNDALFTRKHLEGVITASAPLNPDVLTPVIGGVSFVILVLVIVVCSVSYYSKHKKPGQPTSTVYQPAYPQASQYPPSSSPPAQQTGYCPYCGTPKQSLDAKFCSTCGRSFRGPDIG